MAEEELRESEAAALESSQADLSSGHTTNVTGKSAVPKKRNLKKLSIKAFGVLILVIILILLLNVPIYAIDAISTRLIEETDMQYADGVQSKALVFQNALENGNIPSSTGERLEQEGVTVGYLEGDTFVASNVGKREVAANDAAITYSDADGAALSLKLADGTVVPANRFYYEVNHNVELYNAFTNATYSRAAYYYDEEAQRVFREIGTSRNNYNSGESLNDVMDSIMGSGHNFGLDSQTWHYLPVYTLKDRSSPEVETTWEVITDSFTCSGTTNNQRLVIWRTYNVRGPYYEYDDKGRVTDMWYELDIFDHEGDYGCRTTEADDFVTTLAQSNMNSTGDHTQTTLNTVDTLKVADTVSKEKRSMLLYAGIAESFSRTKAGYGSAGNDTNSVLAAVATIGAVGNGNVDVNDVMNWLYEQNTSTTVNPDGTTKTVTGSAVESPSLYAILTGEKIEANAVQNYSSDRIAKVAENKLGRSEIGKSTVSKTLATSSNLGTTKVGRCAEQSKSSCLSTGATGFENATPKYNIIEDTSGKQNYNDGQIDIDTQAVEKIVDSSLYNNSFRVIKGVDAGELLVEGAVNVGKALAKASGSASGTSESVDKYLALTADVLAMDAAADRLNRSPLDITSKNTFLGSIVYKFAVSSMKSGSFLNKMASVSRVAASAFSSLLPSANAEDNQEELYLSVRGDCETLGYIDAAGSATCSALATFDTSTYDDPYNKMSSWINDNVECSGSKCDPKEDSALAKYISYNELRKTPVGITDGSIIESIEDSKEGKSIFARVLSAISNLFGLSKKIEDGTYNVPPEATGESYVVGGSIWESSDDYKYAQRYISLARAAETLRQYSGDETAYNFEGFGLGNPIARYIETHSDDVIAAANQE